MKPRVAPRFFLRLLVPLLMLVVAPLSRAHDWWLEPSLPRAAASEATIGDTIDVVAFVGIAFRGDRVARDPTRIERFVAIDEQGEIAVDGSPGADPMGHCMARLAGTTVVAYVSKPARVFLRASEFEKYLKDEGLERIVELRAVRGQSTRMGLEQYSRCAKTLVRVATAAPAGPATAVPAVAPVGPLPLGDRWVGLPLELLLETRPAAAAGGGGEMSVQLRWHGEPLEGARVVAVPRDEPGRRDGTLGGSMVGDAQVSTALVSDAPIAVTQRTDGAGRVTLRLPRAGFWLVKAVHMVEAPATTRLDWESYWASLTFDLPAAAAPAAVRSE